MSKSYLGQLAPMPRSLRNNNIGNIRYSSANNWKGKIPFPLNTDANKSFEQFENVHFGIRAMMILIKNYYKQGHTSVKSIISKYAPEFENNTQAYINNVVRMVGQNDIPVLTPDVIKNLSKAIHYVEAGSQWYNHLTNEDFEIGYQMTQLGSGYFEKKKVKA